MWKNMGVGFLVESPGIGYRLYGLTCPRLFRRVVNKEVSVQNSYMGKGGFVSWDVSVRGGLRQSKKFESSF